MIPLRSGDATLTIDADRGGRLASLEVAGQQLLIGPAPGYGPMHWGAFPMVPWAGRVRRGRFTFAGRVYELPLDMPPHAIHGSAYLQSWHVDSVADGDMSMSCDLAWELGGRAWQRVEVGDTSVTCVLGVAAGSPPGLTRDTDAWAWVPITLLAWSAALIGVAAKTALPITFC